MRTLLTVLLATAALAVGLGPAAMAGEDPNVSVKDLVQQLGSDQFAAREAAQRKLIEAGPAARPAVAKAAESDDVEVQTRAQEILRQIDTSIFDSRSKAAVEGLCWSLGTATGTPIVIGGRVVASGGDGGLYVLDLASGKLLAQWKVGDKPLSDPIASGDKAILVTGGSRVTAVDPAGDGNAAWRTDVATNVPLAAGDGRVYVCRADGAVVALDANSGDTVWKKLLKPNMASGVAAANGCVLATGNDDILRAFSPADGKVLWEANTPEGCSHLTVAGDLAVFEAGGKLRAVSLVDGNDRWTRALPAGQQNPVAVRMNIVVNNRKVRLNSDPAPLPVSDGVAYLVHGAGATAVSLKDGEVRWNRALELPARDVQQGQGGAVVINGGMVIVQQKVVVAGGAGGQLQIMTAGGPLGVGQSGEPAVRDGVLYVPCTGGLLAVDAASGNKLWQVQTAQPVVGRPVVADGLLLLTTAGPPPGEPGSTNKDVKKVKPFSHPGLYGITLPK